MLNLLIHDLQLKVKPRRAPQVQACALELTAMLGCWASSGDLANVSHCREASKRLFECMAKPVSLVLLLCARAGLDRSDRMGLGLIFAFVLLIRTTLQTIKGKPRVSSINYRLSKTN